MKHFITSLLLLGAVAFSATLSEFQPIDKTSLSQVVYSFNFEEKIPLKGFRLAKGYSWKWGNGENGNGGLALSRETNEKYTFASIALPKLKPGIRYKLSGKVFIDGLMDKTTGKLVTTKGVNTFGLDVSQNGKYLCSHYVRSKGVQNGKLNWKEDGLTFILPENGTASLCFFLKDYNVRSLNWDSITITALGEQQPVIYPTLPKQLRLDAQGNVKLRVFDFKTKRPETNLVAFAKMPDGKEFSAPVQKGYALFKLGKLPEGCYDVTFVICDTQTRKILVEDAYPLTVTHRTPPKGAIVTDETGRMFIDGKPFFPVGIFMESSTFTPQEMAELKSIGVNTILPYRNLQMRLPETQGTKTSSLAEIQRSLKILEKNEFKICICLIDLFGRLGNTTEMDGHKGAQEIIKYLVNGIKDSPAVMGYYISDENPADQLAPIKAARFTISKIDPFHPVATLTNIPNNFVYFAPTGDVMMSDKYPIRDETTQDMKGIEDAFKKEHSDSQLGLWWVPQIFNWGIYFKFRPYKEWRYPTEEEMRSQNLLSLNYRARAIFSYAYHSIRKQEKMDPGSTQWFWPRVANVMKLTAELEPFFMEDALPTPIKLENKGECSINARMHTANDGRQIAVIVSIGPGKGEAILSIGKTGLKSRFGHTKELGNGQYLYSSMNMASDILE